jgi:CHRD domain/Bacterial Ig domain/Secretion system C-terminal sorting domain/Cohesin domain
MQTIKKHLLGRLLAFLGVVFLTTGMVSAQVSVSVSDVTGRPGEMVTVPVTISGVTSVNSFQFTVNTGADLTYSGYDAAGTLAAGFSLSPAPTVSGSSVTVGGFNSGSGPITSDGTLINLKFTLGAATAAGNLTLGATEIDGAAPAGGATVTFPYVIANIFIDADDETVRVTDSATITVRAVDAMTNLAAFTVDVTVGPEFGGPVTVSGGDLTSSWGNQFQINALGGNVWRVGGFGTPVTGTGSLFKLNGTAAVLGTATVRFSNMTFTDNTGANIAVGGDIASFNVVANTAPTAAAQAVSVDEDGSVVITMVGTDANGDPLTYATTNPANGALSGAAGAAVTYTPTANFNGSDSFTFTVNDGLATSAAATVSITVNAVNDAPTAGAVAGTTPEDTPITVTLTGADIDADPLTYSAGAAGNGTVSIAGDQATYTPNADFNGADSFTYTASDGTASGSATVSITVTPANDAPVVAAIAMTTDEDMSGAVTLTGTDAEGDAITFAIATTPANGLVALSGATATYFPNPNFNGSDSFTYTGSDGTATGAAATVTITVNPVNDAPVFTTELGSTSIVEDDFLHFVYVATDVDGDVLTYSVISPSNATIDGANGDFDWVPTGSAGVNTVQVAVSDGTVTVNSTEASVLVLPVDAFSVLMAGIHENPPVQSPAAGRGFVRIVESSNTLQFFGFVEALSGTFSASHLHLGAVGENGPVLVPLVPDVIAPDGRGASWSISMDMATIPLPPGSTLPELVERIRHGHAYVNVHTSAHGPGEVRGQLLAPDNAPPSVVEIRAPSDVTVVGTGEDRLFSVSWLPGTDPNGDHLNYIYEIATDAAFVDIVDATNFGDGNGFRVTVSEAAQAFDDLTDADPGAVNVGGAVTFWHRIVSTDGGLWTAGPGESLTLTRGLVTANEEETEIPTEFALNGNYPNPFNPSTSILFDLPETANVTVTVTDMLGRQVLSVPTASVDAGTNRSIQIDASQLASGLYLYRVIASGVNTTFAKVGTMTLIK